MSTTDQKNEETVKTEETKETPKDGATVAGATPGAADTAPNASSGSGSHVDQRPAKTGLDLEAAIEKALAAERKAAQELKAAQEAQGRFGKHKPVIELLEKKELSDADLLFEVLKLRHGDKVSDAILYDLAKKFPEQVEPTEEEKRRAEIAAELDRREKEREAAAASKKAQEEAELAEQGKRELEAHMKLAAAVYKANVDKMVGLKAMGASDARYRSLLVEAADGRKDLLNDAGEPDPLKILTVMNDEHVARLKAAGLIKDEQKPATETAIETKPAEGEKDELAEHAAKVFNLHKPKNFKPDAQKNVDPFDEARERLRTYDSEQRQRVQ